MMENLRKGPGGDNREQTGEPDSGLSAYQEKMTGLTRLADLGQLSAGILHEIRNPVSFVNNFSRVSRELIDELLILAEKPLTERSDDDHADQKDLLAMLSENLTKIHENGQRIERIIQDMLAQLRGDAPVFKAVKLPRLLEEYSKLAYQSTRAEDKSFNVALEYDFANGPESVNLVSNEFARVVLNLVSNACFAIQERLALGEQGYLPTIRISTRTTEAGLEIRFFDNGIGIPADVLPKLFEAFFTTKTAGKGTGLGLSLTQSIVETTHGGQISVSSVPLDFTEFTILLPLQ